MRTLSNRNAVYLKLQTVDRGVGVDTRLFVIKMTSSPSYQGCFASFFLNVLMIVSLNLL